MVHYSSTVSSSRNNPSGLQLRSNIKMVLCALKADFILKLILLSPYSLPFFPPVGSGIYAEDYG